MNTAILLPVFLLGDGMRIFLVCALTACVDHAAAQIVSRESVHLKPIGTSVRGSIVLVNRTIPLPEGEFVLSAVEIRDTKLVYGDYAGQSNRLVDVALGQVMDGQLRAAMVATAVLKMARARWEWTDEPCKRDDTLFKRNSVPFMKRNYSQDCLLVNHVVDTLGPAASGVYAKSAAWTRDQGVKTPIPTVVTASITRIEVGEYLAVHYAFNPEAYGCNVGPYSSWTTSAWHKSRIADDPEKSAFVGSVVDFGKAMQIRIGEAFAGRVQVANSLGATTPRVLNCGVTPARAPAKSARSDPVAERLKTLEGLRDQGLISPTEYDERRRKILDSL